MVFHYIINEKNIKYDIIVGIPELEINPFLKSKYLLL